MITYNSNYFGINLIIKKFNRFKNALLNLLARIIFNFYKLLRILT